MPNVFSQSLLALLLGGGVASAADLGDYGIQLFDGENFQQPGPTLKLDPGTEVKFATVKGLKDWNHRVSSLKLGKKAGIVLQGDKFFYVYKADAPKLGDLNNGSYALTVFDKTTQSMPDGARFAKYYDGFGTGSSLTRYSWFVPARKEAKLKVNKWPGTLLDKQDLRYLQIYGKNTRVIVNSKAGFSKEYTYRKADYHLEGDIDLGQIAMFEVLAKPWTASPGLPGPGVPVPGGGAPTPPSPSNLGGLWHSNLGDFNATHQGSNFKGELTFAANPGVKALVFGTINQKKIQHQWFVSPFNFGTGELAVANDYKTIEGKYTSKFDKTSDKIWKLWRP